MQDAENTKGSQRTHKTENYSGEDFEVNQDE